MSSLRNAKLLGGIGAILTLVDLGFIGFILKLLAVRDIANATDRHEIFEKYLWAAVLGAVSGLILFGTVVTSMLRASHSASLSLGTLGIGGAIAAILLIVSAWFMKQSYDMIAEETGVRTFHTVALLYLVGAVLLLVLIGALVIFVAAILEIVAFFSLPDELSRNGGSDSMLLE